MDDREVLTPMKYIVGACCVLIVNGMAGSLINRVVGGFAS